MHAYDGIRRTLYALVILALCAAQALAVPALVNGGPYPTATVTPTPPDTATPTPLLIGACCQEHNSPGCSIAACNTCVCSGPGANPFCCNSLVGSWDGQCVGTAATTCAVACGCATPTPLPVTCPYTFTDNTGALGATCAFHGTYNAGCGADDLHAVWLGDGTRISIIFSTQPTFRWIGRVTSATLARMTQYQIGDGTVTTLATPFNAQRAAQGLNMTLTDSPIQLCDSPEGCDPTEMCPFIRYSGFLDAAIDGTHPPPSSFVQAVATEP